MKRLLVLFLTCWIPAHAAIAFVSCTSADTGGASGTSIQTPGGYTATAGNGVYLFGLLEGGNCSTDTATVTDVSGDSIVNVLNGLTGAASVANGGLKDDSSGAACTGMWYIKNSIGNAAERYTITWTRSQGLALSVLQMSGQDTSAPLDANAFGQGNTANTVTTANWTTTVANELEVTGASSDAFSRTWTPDTGWTKPSSCDSPIAWSTIQYKNVTSIQTGVNTTMTISGGATFLHAMVATFKQTGSGGTNSLTPAHSSTF